MTIRIDISKSPKIEKKWKIEIDTPQRKKTLHIGDSSMEDYTQHKDVKRKMNYILRHYPRENWEDPFSAGFWSRFLLWSHPSFEKAKKTAIQQA